MAAPMSRAIPTELGGLVTTACAAIGYEHFALVTSEADHELIDASLGPVLAKRLEQIYIEAEDLNEAAGTHPTTSRKQ